MLALMLVGCGSENPVVSSDASEVCLRGGEFRMGSDEHFPEERPTRVVEVAPFCIDRYEVSNADFKKFVAATGYQTLAERGPSREDYPDAPEAFFRPGSAVFVYEPSGSRSTLATWWEFREAANWKSPAGVGSAETLADDHPVVHIAFDDAMAYARWKGRDLPTEAEWEFAARAGTTSEFAWGDERAPNGVEQANTWQGFFPVKDLATDGYRGTAPIGTFPANGFGLYDMIGNVWEWTKTEARTNNAPLGSTRNIKGGSYLCAPSYCARYRPAAKQAHETGLGTSHIGFRTVRRESSQATPVPAAQRQSP